MTNEAKDTLAIDLSTEQTHSDAASTTPPHEASSNKATHPPASSQDQQDLASLPSRENEPPFAHDINHKLDELELDITQLTKRFKASQGTMSSAMGDLKSRTALMTQEIATVSAQLEQSDDQKQESISALENRLKDATFLLTEQLNAVDSQLEHHHSNINSLKKELEITYQTLEERLIYLQQDTQAKLQDLYTHQEHHKRTQQAFTEYLDELQIKSDATADDVYGLKTEFVAEKRVITHRFKLFAGITAALIVSLAGTMAYLYTPSSAQSALTTEQIDSRITEASKAFATTISATKAAVADLETNMEKKLDRIDATMTSMHATNTTEQSNLTESLSGLAEKVAALQLSLYGPEDGNALPEAKINIHDINWVAQQAPEHYTIQLVGVYRHGALIEFANRNLNNTTEAPVAFTVSEYRGQSWYNLLYGNYASFTDAQNALDKLPANLERNSPWIRKMASVQNTAN